MTDKALDASEGKSLADLKRLIPTDPQRATEELRALLRGDPLNAAGYRLLAEALQKARDWSGDGGVRSTLRGADPLLSRASHALHADDLETAEIILRRRMLERPDDIDALYLIAKLAQLLDFDSESEALLRLAIEFDPNFSAARVALARMLDKRHRPLEACEELEPVLAQEPNNLIAKALKAAAVSRAGEYDKAIEIYEEMIQSWPDEPGLWSSYGYTLKTVGRTEEGEAAMRHATKLAPHMGEAWWNLSNLKMVHLEPGDVATMLGALERCDIDEVDRWHLHFALGKAFEDAGDPVKAFQHYEQGNEVRRRSTNYQPDLVTAEVNASERFFTAQFFSERNGWGVMDRDPIFVLGMPRAGSTLVEQILASHPQVEGTKELPEIPIIAKDLGRGRGEYYRNITEIGPDRVAKLGRQYLERAALHRKTNKPYFVDKMPNNWLHVALIHLLLPNAKIIDARRHPLACGFSNFKQNYADGQTFSYDLQTIGHHYREYVRMMAHIDKVLPDRVHRLIHERLVEDTEGEVRKMLDYLELPFDPACLRFYETERAVRTPSSEQVRRPIYRQGVEQWREFEPWLSPLKDALGSVLDAYPEVPGDLRK